MRLRSTVFLNLARVYFIVGCIICASGKQYSQSEIDDAFEKMISNEEFYLPVKNQRGCWYQNIIPYNITSGFTFGQIKHIKRQIYQIQNRTCVRWVDLSMMSGVKKYVSFVRTINDSYFCDSWEDINIDYEADNKTMEPQVITEITLGDQCFLKKAVIHEMFHAMGFQHEHQRIDRDCYVIVDDYEARHKKKFKIIYGGNTFEKWPYDKRSISHYKRVNNFIMDIDEPLRSERYRYRLGETYGWWGAQGKSEGMLSCLDAYKINYRFCGAPDFCAIQPQKCQKIEKQEKREGCKELYQEIVKGTVKPSKKYQ